MKWLIVPILMFLLLAQTFSKWMIMLEYNINKDYIAAHFCVNKNRPMLHCNGKCQLMKKLAADEDESNKANSSSTASKLLSFDVLYVEPLTNLTIFHLLANRLMHHTHYLLNNYTSPLCTIFHPPSLA